MVRLVDGSNQRRMVITKGRCVWKRLKREARGPYGGGVSAGSQEGTRKKDGGITGTQEPRGS